MNIQIRTSIAEEIPSTGIDPDAKSLLQRRRKDGLQYGPPVFRSIGLHDVFVVSTHEGESVSNE